MASTQSKMSQPIAIALLVFLAFAPRFWNLDGLADVVFDEVYYPKFAQNYLQGIDFFDAHPPLGKYLIALGIKLFGYQPWGYRCITALAGALIPIFVYLLVQKWTNRHFLAWLSGVFTALDGLLLVESRYGLINIFLVLFGLCSQLCLISALRAKTASAVGLWTLASGIFLGASISVKWTGLGYLFSAIAMVVVNGYYLKNWLNLYQLFLGLLLIPAIFYLLQWIPHLLINPATPLIELHQQIFNFHQNLGSGEPLLSHPYCSPWWSWVFMIRSTAYFFEFRDLGIVYVNGMGNPLLYWFGAGAVLYALLRPKLHQHSQGLSLYLTLSFLANLLPWVLARRCTFLYHYMPASVFAFICLAIIADLCWRQEGLQSASIIITAGVAIAFFMWLPVYIGLPIPHYYWRMIIWMPTWI